MRENEKNPDLIYGELLNCCWQDEKVLDRFRNEPAAVLAEAGIPVKAGVNYHVVEQTQDKYYVILPESYPAEKLDDIRAEAKAKAGLGDDTVIEILWNTVSDVYLPYYPAPKFKALSDEELEAAGGIHVDPEEPHPLSMTEAWAYEQDVVVTHAFVATEIITGIAVVTLG